MPFSKPRRISFFPSTLLALAVVFHGCYVDAAPTEFRQSVNFNREWKFKLGDVTGAQEAGFDDTKWEVIALPHSFSIPYFGSPQFYQGYGWYRKHFNVPASFSGRRISLECDGVFRVAEVFVNGTQIGIHQGGYTGFTFDLTSAVKAGDNVLAVRVNNLWNPRLAPRAGEHTFSGGIYRDVRLVVTAPLHVAWYGTSVTTPELSTDAGTVNVKTEVVNDSGHAKYATVQSTIVDSNGTLITRVQSTEMVAANTRLIFDQTTPSILNPRLWSPSHPYLYSVKTVVLDADRPVDNYLSPFGFRWFKFTPDQGFFLNGEHLYILGANVHQDHAGWGDAVADSGFLRDINLVKQAGFFFIRGSHYPHAPAFANACDQLGVLLWSENCFWGIGGFRPDGYWDSSAYPPNPADQPDFEASVKQQLGEMIHIYRNHPSIIVWSMCNEPFFTTSSAVPKMRAFLSELVSLSHSLDPSRPAAIGGSQRPLDDNRIDKLGDLAGYNGDGSTLPTFQNPGIPSFVSEYGSTSAIRPGNYQPGWGSLSADNGQPAHAWRSGQSLWCMFDHGSIAGRTLGQMGIVDYFRIPKRAWYWYRNAYCHIPPPRWPPNGIPAALRLTSDKTVLKSTDGADDAQLLVTVLDKDGDPISNSPPITLSIESGPGELPTGSRITFDPNTDIPIRDGQAAIEFRSYYAGRTLLRATSPGIKDATVEITTLGQPVFIPGETKPVTERPYVPYTGADAANPLITLGLQNPTRASSEAPGHSSALANDGNAATFWQAQSGQDNPWWSVDLEKLVSIDTIKITFPSKSDWRYRIESSADGVSHWQILQNYIQSKDNADIRSAKAPAGATGRVIRITFAIAPTGKPAEISEFQVIGRLKPQ